MADFNHNTGGIQSSSSTEFDPLKAGAPSTGFSEAPKAECKQGEAGPGVGNTRKGIH